MALRGFPPYEGKHSTAPVVLRTAKTDEEVQKLKKANATLSADTDILIKSAEERNSALDQYKAYQEMPEDELRTSCKDAGIKVTKKTTEKEMLGFLFDYLFETD
jgi:hypothetical protein